MQEEKSSSQENLKTDSKKKNLLETIVLPILNYIGFIGSAILGVAYIVLVIILIIGFETQQDIVNTVIFAAVNGVVGIAITQLLKIQGITFAKDLPENKPILDRYYRTKTKDKKYRSISYFWGRSVIKDILIKGVTVAASTGGIIYLAIEGSKDYTLLLMAIVNILLFACFGFLALKSAYEFFNNQHIPYIINELGGEECSHSTEKNSET